MARRLKNLGRNTPMLLPPDLLTKYFRANVRGTSDEQHSPRMMLALLVYYYATGSFSSQGIENATREVRLTPILGSLAMVGKY